MPTEQEIEAAARGMKDYLDEFHPAPDGFCYEALARDALTAAEEVRGQVSEDDARAECSRLGIDPDGLCADGGIDAWMVVRREMIDKALARRGAVQAVPDDWVLVPKEPNIAMIQAMALAAEEQLRLTSPTEGRMKVNFSHVSVFRAAIAAAPKLAVPDEAAIRADERERCAKIAEDMRTRLAGVLVGPALYVGPNAPAAIADAIRADAQKPGDKP